MSKKLELYLSAYLPVLLWAGLIFVLSSQQTLPGVEVTFLDFLLKKFAHIFVYAVLYFSTARAVWMTTSSKNKWARVVIPLGFCLLYALSDEFHQTFVPGRTGTFRDIGYDMLGTGIVFLRKYRYI